MAYYLEIQKIDEPSEWIWCCDRYRTKNIAIERAKKLIEVIPLIKVRVAKSLKGKVVWSNVD